VRVPELELLRFSVMDSSLGNKDIIGEFTLPIESIQQGYHNVSLKVPQLYGKFEQAESSCLFVHLGIKSGKVKIKIK